MASCPLATPELESGPAVSIDDVDYDAHLKMCGLTDAEVKRLQGLVEGSVAPSSISNIFRKVPPIELGSLFPMISFRDPVELNSVAGGLLIIAREGFNLNQAACCPCGVEPTPIRAE